MTYRMMSLFLFFLVITDYSVAQQSSEATFLDVESQFTNTIERARESLIDFRRDLHRHPEVSGQEKRTAGKIASRLRALNLDVRTKVGGHGVVAFLQGGKPGPVVAFRADMDAVFSDQPDPAEFASQSPGIRHICGHDIHTTIGVALAEGLASIRDELEGSILFIFQPAEENVQGARAMIEDDALKNPKPDAIYALHTAPFEVGQIATIPGVMFAGRDQLTVTLSGRTDLTAVAGKTQQIINDLSTIPPDVNSAKADFISARVFRSEAFTHNNTWNLHASLSTTSDEMRSSVKKELRAALDPLMARGMSYEIDYRERIAGGVFNNIALEQASYTPLRSVVGDSGLVIMDDVPTRFSEDFGFFQDYVPGVMYFLGVSNSEKGWVGMPHAPGYMADEEAIFVGARAMAAVMLDFLNAP